ncbi:MAG TPA: type II secretion system F family protein [Verrucomicrobiae bacterium]|nr:type II secretion system F family protein [Verrucomicrobiae bacterium]
MPEFCYVAMDSRGKETKGKLEVADQNEAIGRLKSMGYFPTRVEAAKPKALRASGAKGGPTRIFARKRGFEIHVPGFGAKVNSKALTGFTRQLARLVDSGLPLLRGLRLIERQEKNPALRRIMGDLAISIEGGSTFSEALGQHPRVFNHLFVNMVKAGEVGGVLEIVLARLAQFMEKAQKIRGKVKAALFYPAAVMFVAGAVVAILMVFVVPRFKEIFNDLLEGASLPKFTQFVLGASEFVAHNILYTILSAIALIVMLKLAVRTKPGRKMWDRIALSFPLLGPVVSKVAIARFARTLGTLLSSGVPVLQALTIVRETAGNVIVGEAVMNIHESVKEGETITAPMDHCSVFPPTVIGMVDVGEQTGALPEMLMKVADDYEEEVDNAVTAMTSLLEPVMIVFLAVIVGSIVIALFWPLVIIIEKMGGSSDDMRSQRDNAGGE